MEFYSRFMDYKDPRKGTHNPKKLSRVHLYKLHKHKKRTWNVSGV